MVMKNGDECFITFGPVRRAIEPDEMVQIRYSVLEKLQAELKASTEKYDSDLNKLHTAIRHTPDVDGGFVEACCAQIEHIYARLEAAERVCGLVAEFYTLIQDEEAKDANIYYKWKAVLKAWMNLKVTPPNVSETVTVPITVWLCKQCETIHLEDVSKCPKCGTEI
jgi:rubrerythrin